MNALPAWSDDTNDDTSGAVTPVLAAVRRLPEATLATMWRGTELGTPVASVVSSGWAELDRAATAGEVQAAEC